MKIIYYLFSSITFLQFYIPIAIESNKRNFKNIFIYHDLFSYKKYAQVNTRNNFKIAKKITNKFDIKLIDSKEINLSEISGIVFMVDGDIYGTKKSLKFSSLKNLDKNKTIRVSLIENLNYRSNYNYYINDITYAIFSNKFFTDQYNFFSDKNIYLGNTKYDNIPDYNKLLEKYKFNKNDKLCLILYPKENFEEKDLINVIEYLKKLEFKIILKFRPKDKMHTIPKIFLKEYCVCSDIYPNESLELMKISELCIIFSSSANEETIFSKIPCIDFNVDDEYIRNDFLLDDKVCKRINNWKNITFNKFENILSNLEKKNSEYFNIIKKKYLFTHTNSAEKYLDFLLNNNLKIDFDEY